MQMERLLYVVQNVRLSALWDPATGGVEYGATQSTASGIIAHGLDRQLVENDVWVHVRRKIEHPTIGARLETAGATVLHPVVLATAPTAQEPQGGPFLVSYVALWLQ